jgi:iron-sulfur cluster assembly accessory protein
LRHIFPLEKTRKRPGGVDWAVDFEVLMSGIALEAPVGLTATAARRISEILSAEPEGSVLRIGVEGGGCSGFQYTYAITRDRSDEDLVLREGGATVVIDPTSLDFLRGSQIDFVDDLVGRMFKIHNPAATASCGCGSSFSI